MQAGNDKIVTASEDNTVCVWYTKTAVAKVSYPCTHAAYTWTIIMIYHPCTGADR